jgi:hypothetical protein
MLLHLAWSNFVSALKPSHNLLVRGSNPCGGTNHLASVLTITSCEATDSVLLHRGLLNFDVPVILVNDVRLICVSRDLEL